MIRFLLKRLIAEKEIAEGRRVTLDEIAEATKIHKATLSKISNNKDYNATIDLLDRLCAYFDVPLGELAEYVKESDKDTSIK